MEQALALFRQAGSLYDVSNLLQDLNLAYFEQGRLDEAASRLNEALAIARRLGAPAQLAGVLNNLGWLHYVRGEYREALALYEEGLVTARRGNVLWLQANILVGMADLYRDVGAYDRAEPLYHAGWQIAWKSEPELAFHILLARADMYRWRCQRTRAFALLGQARQMVEGEDLDLERHGLLPTAEGILLAEDGQVEAGIDLLLQSDTVSGAARSQTGSGTGPIPAGEGVAQGREARGGAGGVGGSPEYGEGDRRRPDARGGRAVCGGPSPTGSCTRAGVWEST